MPLGRVVPSGPQGGDEFFSDRRSIGLPPRLLHDFAHEATHGSIFPGGKVFGGLGMSLYRCGHPSIHRVVAGIPGQRGAALLAARPEASPNIRAAAAAARGSAEATRGYPDTCTLII